VDGRARFRAEWVVVSEELLILASCLLRPMSRNSVLEEFRVRRFSETYCSAPPRTRLLVCRRGRLCGRAFKIMDHPSLER